MNKFTCFLIDDDGDDHEIFHAVIEAITPAIQCFVAGDGQRALGMLREGDVSPDIIFLDLNMPLMNGRQFLEEIKRLNIAQGIPVIVLTTSVDQNSKTEMLALGATEFLTKPDTFSEWETILKHTITPRI